MMLSGDLALEALERTLFYWIDHVEGKKKNIITLLLFA